VEFEALLTDLCADLSRQLIGDAEGADHDIDVKVVGAVTEDGAAEVGRAIARSNLFKTAIAGRDPNWGRILSAAGTVPPEVAPYQPERVDVSVNGVMVCRGGGVGEPRHLVDLAPRKVDIVVNLNAGQAEATILTNDLTHEYVHINADYST
jgi:glutamate N-acetyltransferase/amino-acid N-acetyltransferase